MIIHVIIFLPISYLVWSFLLLHPKVINNEPLILQHRIILKQSYIKTFMITKQNKRHTKQFKRPFMITIKKIPHTKL